VRFVCDDFVVMRELAGEGAGVTFLPSTIAKPYLRSGKLEHVSNVSVPGRSSGVPLVMLYSSRGPVSRNVTAFGDFVVQWLKTSPLG
jgi:DNA-binding transcriptional LysR family regulator